MAYRVGGAARRSSTARTGRASASSIRSSLGWLLVVGVACGGRTIDFDEEFQGADGSTEFEFEDTPIEVPPPPGTGESGGGGAAGQPTPVAGAGAVPTRSCGNGLVDPPEQCDGSNFNGESCATVSMYAAPNGVLRCTSSCTFDVSGCARLGTGGTTGGGGFYGGGGRYGMGGFYGRGGRRGI